MKVQVNDQDGIDEKEGNFFPKIRQMSDL